MFTVEDTIFINRKPQEVFDFASNPANAPLWQGSAVSAEWTSEGPVGVGATQRSVVRFLGREIESTVEYIAWDPPKGYTVKVISGPVLFEGTTRYEAKGDGTLVIGSATADAGGFL